MNNYCDSPLVATADFTDFIVQPKYFFMGHFSKFIPSGSIRIKSHIVGNFSNVLDSPNIQSGVELGIFPCEDSSRQLWEINNSRIALAIPAFSDVQIEDSTAVRLCISLGNTPQSYLQVKACSVLEGNDNSLQFIPVKLQLSTMPSSVKSRAGHFSVYQLRQKVLSGSSELCFGVDQASQNGEDGGALLKLGFCSVSDLSQLWAFQDISVTDTVSLSQYMLHKKIISIAMSSAEESSCLTAGWPFLTGTAFSTPDGASGVVVMNESPSLTKYELKTARSSAALDLGISARSIQTIMFPL